MSNRIDQMDPRLLGKIGEKIGETGTAKPVGSDVPASGREAVNPPATDDTVELTSSAKLLERLDTSLASMPEIDQARVAEVKALIENGEYEIDVRNIADALLRTDDEFSS